MKKIIFGKELEETIDFSEVVSEDSIFAKRGGVLVGMITNNSRVGEGWLLNVGATGGAYGYHESCEECINVGHSHGYTFYT